MNVRYTDLDPESASAFDFVIRKRTPSLMLLVLVFTSVMLITLTIGTMVEDRSSMLLMLASLLIIAGWYAIMVVQRNRDLVLTTEFQNALFASALGINNKFCLIIKRDGSIVYLDRSFQKMFPDFLKQPRRTIDVLLEQGKLSKDESKKVFDAIEQGVFSRVMFDIRGAGNEYHKVVMSIEPITRPKGFIMLRGREFVPLRSHDGIIPVTNKLDKSSITLFSHVMDTMNMGVYMTNPNGALIYVNPVLEQWLGYSDGETNSKTLSLQDIIHQPGKRSETIEPDNYEGEIMLQKKDGGMMKSFINQKVIRDDEGKIMGCTALVHSYADQNSDLKKKLW